MKYSALAGVLFLAHVQTALAAPVMYAPASRPEPQRTLGSADNAPKWTAADVKAMCDARWPGQNNSAADCLRRNQRKIGRPLTPADQQLLQPLRPSSTPSPKQKP